MCAQNLYEVDWSLLPVPVDDGAASHLAGCALPDVVLPATTGASVQLSALTGTIVIYVYPMTGRPDVPLPQGWDLIPGARGCTPQSCAFRDHFAELSAAGVDHLFGLSAQSTGDQCEAAARLHLPFPLLSDREFALATALRLPVFEVSGARLLKRLTIIARNRRIVHVFYPVFPPDRGADDVLAWLAAHPEVSQSLPESPA